MSTLTATFTSRQGRSENKSFDVDKKKKKRRPGVTGDFDPVSFIAAPLWNGLTFLKSK
jgi:hypothetical protein